MYELIENVTTEIKIMRDIFNYSFCFINNEFNNILVCMSHIYS